MIQLINADMLDAMNDIAEVDAIITDPAYFSIAEQRVQQYITSTSTEQHRGPIA